jgi:hypothetical protein
MIAPAVTAPAACANADAITAYAARRGDNRVLRRCRTDARDTGVEDQKDTREAL